METDFIAMHKHDFIKLTDCPYYLLYRVSLLSTAALKNGFISAGIERLRPAYLGTLMGLWQEERKILESGEDESQCGIKLIELSKRAGLEPSTMTGLIDRMVRDGLVCRTNDPKDRRVQLICLTERGRSIQESVMNVIHETFDRLFDGISEKQIDQTKRFLKKVLNNALKGQ